MFDFRKSVAALWPAASVGGLLGADACRGQAQTLKAVMHSDVKILDPIWTTAYIQRNFGYMVWDTLFAMDDKFEVKPQMVDKYDVSADKLTWTFTLRDGLVWSDGKPVTSDDCIASIKRWAAARFDGPEDDGLGRRLREGRRQDLQDEDEGAVRPGAPVARQAVVERAVHDAEADGRDRSRHPDQGRGRDRLRSVRVRRQRMEARREGRVHQEHQVQAARRAAPRAWPAARSSRSTGSSGSPCPTCRPRWRRSRTARST